MTRDAFIKVKTDELIAYLEKNGMEVSRKTKKILKANRIDGDALLLTKKEELMNLGILYGDATRMMRRIPPNIEMKKGPTEDAQE